MACARSAQLPAGLPRLWGRRAAIRPKDRPIRRQSSRAFGSETLWACAGCRSHRTMKLFNGLFILAALGAGATGAHAQVLAPYEIGGPPYAIVSDVEGPYAPPPGEPASARYSGHMMLLPPQEGYAGGRDSGFLPLGVPQQRGL